MSGFKWKPPCFVPGFLDSSDQTCAGKVVNYDLLRGRPLAAVAGPSLQRAFSFFWLLALGLKGASSQNLVHAQTGPAFSTAAFKL
jgi:hypothetical protein